MQVIVIAGLLVVVVDVVVGAVVVVGAGAGAGVGGIQKKCAARKAEHWRGVQAFIAGGIKAKSNGQGAQNSHAAGCGGVGKMWAELGARL